MDDSHPLLRSRQMRDAIAARTYGTVLRLARRAQGLTQKQLGRRCGYSAATISRFETGARPLTDIDTLWSLARELAIPPAMLGLAPAPATRGDVVPAGTPDRHIVTAVTRVDPVHRRQLLTGVTSLTGATLLGPAATASATGPDSVIAHLETLLVHGAHADTHAMSQAQVSTSLATAWNAFETCRYRELADRLPGLVAAARAGRDTATGPTRDQFSAALSSAYVLACELCVKVNEDAMAWVAADRALTAARASGDPATIAAASRAVAMAMRRQGHYDGATGLLTGTALTLGADQGDQPPDLLAAYGALLCTAAYTSAQHGKRAQALDLISEAEQAAIRMKDLRVGRSVFGTTNVAVYQIGIHTALGDPAAALDHAHSVDRHLLPTAERHARFWIDTARAWHQYGRIDRAYQALRAAENHAPEEIRRPSVRTLISTLLYAPGTSPQGLRALADRAGALT